MEVVDHGGECCGIQHIYHFSLNDDSDEHRIKSLDRSIEAALESYFDGDYGEDDDGEDDDGDYAEARAKHMATWMTLVEVVLTDGQLPIWEKIVTDRGFKEVTEFKNSNSGNVCHVFHLVTNSK